MESLERRLHRIDNCIAEGEVLLLRSANGVFLVEIADADGGMIGRSGEGSLKRINRSGNICIRDN
ncbi:MAG: hypothetical protein Q7V05_06460 [Methanoregula sp.]|nr:hypothetical protein [Methanoregula sp.]